MNKSSRILLVALAMIGVTALGMGYLRKNQKLGLPGVKWAVIPNSSRLQLFLPEYVLDYDSVEIPTDTNVLNGLPHDTSFATRTYTAMDKSWLQMRIVMMGTDRTSIHKPQFCLKGSGWDIDDAKSSMDMVHMEKPQPYDLPVMKLLSSRELKINNQPVIAHCIYVYWFVADNDLTADHTTRMWKSATHLLRSGELERWSYVSCFAICLPGQEDATYERMKKFIVASVPQFQLADNLHVQNRELSQTAPISK
jgi:hypothetical protein